MHTLSNNHLSISVADKGAELQSIYNHTHQLEYMWQADPLYWPKHSPVLFPIVGGLKNNQYTYQGNAYNLPRHGFARDHYFTLTEASDSLLRFALQSNEATLVNYPFHFIFEVIYTLREDVVEITFRVSNTGPNKMFFSVGAHPAFALPLVTNTTYNDYYIEFEKAENAGRWPLSAEGLLMDEPIPFLESNRKLPLDKSLFAQDAIVFKHLNSTTLHIKSEQTDHGLTILYDGFPYMGMWAAKGADFICIEPWCGIADSIHASGNIEEKKGMENLDSGDTFERTYTVQVF